MKNSAVETAEVAEVVNENDDDDDDLLPHLEKKGKHQKHWRW